MSHPENILPVFYSAVKTKQWKSGLSDVLPKSGEKTGERPEKRFST